MEQETTGRRYVIAYGEKKNQLSYLAVNHLNYNNDLGSKTDMFMGSITS